MSQAHRTFQSNSPSNTAAYARLLADELDVGDVVLLSGDIGSGKTHFARALITHRLAKTGAIEDVPSPTFTIVQTYFDGKHEIWHSDLYRLSDPFELDELGLYEAFETSISIVEWPELLADSAPKTALHISISVRQDDLRIIEVSGDAKRWASFLGKMPNGAL